MNDTLHQTITLAAALGSALIAGLFFAFSVCVMKALARQPAPHGIAAMQAINVVIINPIFMGAFLGTAALCGVLVLSTLFGWHEPTSLLGLIGSLLYLVGSVVVTMGSNVPRNNALAEVAADGEQGAGLWARYVPEWTAWNHVRTVASLAAAALLILSL